MWRNCKPALDLHWMGCREEAGVGPKSVLARGQVIADVVQPVREDG